MSTSPNARSIRLAILCISLQLQALFPFSEAIADTAVVEAHKLDATRAAERGRKGTGAVEYVLSSGTSIGSSSVADQQVGVVEAILEPNPPALCAGYGNPLYITGGLQNWEGGMSPWIASTRDVANPDTFDTPDWAVVGSLPGGRSGKAAFVPDLNQGDCVTDDESGVLTLTGPPTQIPQGAYVPRVTVDHWIATEIFYFGETPEYYDGGNIKISVNSGPYQLIPASAIEFNPYNETLHAFGNTNPMAGEPAFSGTDGEGLLGSWGQTQINLFGIAGPGNTIRLRFEFGIDGCGGVDGGGWYVDTVALYRCSEELPPSSCGNGVLDENEECDDGNDFIGDGCSNACQIEPGWSCTDPVPPGDVSDPGFEQGSPNNYWTEESTNFDSLICDEVECGTGVGSGPADGLRWAWLGGVDKRETARLSQTVTVPTTSGELHFDLEMSYCDSSSDYMEVLLDGTPVYSVDGSSPLCGITSYSPQVADISAFANGGAHQLQFHAETFANNSDVTNFFLDNVSIPGVPSICDRSTTQLTLTKQVVNDNGGLAAPSAWTLAADGPSPFSGPGPTVSSPSGITPGTYNLSESGGPAGYSPGPWVCSGGTQVDADSVTVASNEIVTCTIINNDIAPILTLAAQVTNNNGGSAVPADWILTATGPTGFSGSGAGVSSGPGFDMGTYNLSASGPAGYSASAWVCTGVTQDDADTITLALGQSATCTITYDDIAPTLTVLKTIVNDDGGTVTDPNAFGLKVDGNAVQHGAINTLTIGPHLVSEDGLPGYEAGFWAGSCAADGSITLAPGQQAECTITNDDFNAAERIFADGFETD